jgi:uncharacterized protein YaiL (DUF2058 family)
MRLKKRKTMAKMMREQELKERRERKTQKREAARLAKLRGGSLASVPDGDQGHEAVDGPPATQGTTE